MCYYFQTVCDNQNWNKFFKGFKNNIFSVFHFLLFYNFLFTYSNTVLLALLIIPLVQFSSVTQSCLTLCSSMDCRTPGCPVHHNSWSLIKLMFIESVMPSNHLILCRPLLLLLSILPSMRVLPSHD